MMCIKISLEFSEINIVGPSTGLEVLGVKVGGFVVMRSSITIIHPFTICKRKFLIFSHDLEKLFCVAT